MHTVFAPMNFTPILVVICGTPGGFNSEMILRLLFFPHNSQASEKGHFYCSELLVINFFNPHPEDRLIDFRERGREGERRRNIDWLPLVYTSTGDQTCNPDMCPEWESNPQPFGLPDSIPIN